MENFKNILVPYDFKEQADIALSQSYNLARLSNLEITLLYVHEEGGFFSKFFADDQSDSLIKKMETELEKVATEKSNETGLKISSMVTKGKTYAKIVEIAELIKAKFIVMGTSSSSDPKDNVIGANSSRVIRNAKCPVITIGSEGHYDGCRSILLPIDLTKESRQKVSWAIEFAKLFNSSIKVVSLLWSVNHNEISAQIKAQVLQVKNFIEERGISCQAEVVQIPGESLMIKKMLEYAEDQKDVDLIMIMTQQETGLIPFFVDKEASEVIRLSSIPVMSIVPKDTGETLAR